MLKFNCQAVFDILGVPYDSALYDVDRKDSETVRLVTVSALPLPRPGLTHTSTQATAVKRRDGTGYHINLAHPRHWACVLLCRILCRRTVRPLAACSSPHRRTHSWS